MKKIKRCKGTRCQEVRCGDARCAGGSRKSERVRKRCSGRCELWRCYIRRCETRRCKVSRCEGVRCEDARCADVRWQLFYTHRGFCTEKLLHIDPVPFDREAFTQAHTHTHTRAHTLLHTEALHTNACTHRPITSWPMPLGKLPGTSLQQYRRDAPAGAPPTEIDRIGKPQDASMKN